MKKALKKSILVPGNITFLQNPFARYGEQEGGRKGEGGRREGGREEEREGGRKGGREGGREGGRTLKGWRRGE